MAVISNFHRELNDFPQFMKREGREQRKQKKKGKKNLSKAISR